MHADSLAGQPLRIGLARQTSMLTELGQFQLLSFMIVIVVKNFENK